MIAKTDVASAGSSGARSWAARGVGWFGRLAFRKAIWLAPLVWALHEAEEWNIDEFERANFVDPGYFSLIDRPILWLGLAQVALQGVIWAALTAWPRIRVSRRSSRCRSSSSWLSATC